MLELIVVRHGQSVADIENRLEGRANFSLTDVGRVQAEKLGYWLNNNMNFDYIISSPLKRAFETSQIVSSICNKEIICDERLMEWNNGVLAGLLRTEALKKYPVPVGGRKYFQRISQGESLIDLRARTEEFLAELMDTSADRKSENRILIVAHGGLINMLFQSFLNLPIKNEVSIHTGDTGVHIWRISEGKKEIIMLNGKEHL
jgi:2,3-bisphosphoglycerate-dependent phosphoglycerate mutase